MEHKPEDGSPSWWFSPAALLASWLCRFCSGSDDHHDELAGDDDANRPTEPMSASAAANYLTYSPHKIKFS
jgi:hypothetical protein